MTQEIIINGKLISYTNPNQIINMGGPWVGNLLVDNNEVTEDVIIDNIYYHEAYNNLYFIKYHKISKWQKENYFTINSINFNSQNIYQSDLKFNKIYVEKIDSKQIVYYDAFHGEDESKKRTLHIDALRLKNI